jgi:hypothetical protein
MHDMQVTGFAFLDEDAANYVPPPELAAFLSPEYEKPIYIGFGSLVLEVRLLSAPPLTLKLENYAASEHVCFDGVPIPCFMPH